MKYFLIILLCLPLIWAQGQGFTGNLRLSGSLAVQEQDRRLFGWPEFPAREILAREQQRFLYQVSVGLHKTLLYRPDFTLEAGLTFSGEFNTFSRPFDHTYFTRNPAFDLRFIGIYQVRLIQVPLQVNYRLFKTGPHSFVYVGAVVLPGLHYMKTIKSGTGKLSILSTLSRITVAPYGLEINPHLGFQRGRWGGMLAYRAWQYKRWDPVIFNNMLFRGPDYNGPPTPLDTYNPHKVWLTLSYELPRSTLRRK
ncbi:MAG: hypothetical protein SF053_03470 [Bacteroidia bacterium]|nr:hypothetical protein [Bacteroidia bacterium]